MADYDLYSNIKPVFGSNAEVVMDGTNFTASIDTVDWKSVVFFASTHAPVAYADAAWTVQSSDDGITFGAAAADHVLWRTPSDGTTTSKAFHVGYIGKKRYVRAAFNCGGTAAAVIASTAAAPATPTSVTSSSTTVTVTKTSHGIVAGQYVTVAGATQSAYNGTFRVVTVPDANTFTYTALSSPSASPATGTITYTALTYWANDPGADLPTGLTTSASVLDGNYLIDVVAITSLTPAFQTNKNPANTGNGTITVGTVYTGSAAVLNEILTFVCTATASNAGTFTVYRADGSTLTTLTVGILKTVQVNSVNAFQITVADGSSDWALNDRFDFKITDAGASKYKLTDPDGNIVGYPVGGVAFTSSHLNFTVPDTTVAVSHTNAELTIAVTHGLAKGQLSAVLGNPISGPLFSGAIET